jgi:hypothetical protein
MLFMAVYLSFKLTLWRKKIMKFMKSIGVLLCFGVSLATRAGSDRVVTEPYEPSLAVRCPLVKMAGAAIAAAGLGVAAQHTILETPGSRLLPLGLACAAAGVVKMHHSYKTGFLDLLLTDPEKALGRVKKVSNACSKEGEAELEHSVSDEVVLFKKLVKKHEKNCPVFLLGECTSEDWGACCLSRAYCPQYRDQYESRVCDSLLEKLQKNGDAVHYVDFGSGGAFQTLVVLARTLSKKPDSSLAVHLIDPKHTPHTVSRDTLQVHRAVNIHDDYNLEPIMPQLLQHGREEWGGKNDEDSVIRKGILSGYALVEEQGKQMIGWLAKTFPDAKLSLSLHESSQSYLNYLEKIGLPSPDVISAADIQDEMSLIHGSMQGYSLLCRQTLQKKPDSINWLLGKKSQSTGCLTQLSLTPLSGASTAVSNPDLETIYSTDSVIPVSLWDLVKAKISL